MLPLIGELIYLLRQNVDASSNLVKLYFIKALYDSYCDLVKRDLTGRAPITLNYGCSGYSSSLYA